MAKFEDRLGMFSPADIETNMPTFSTPTAPAAQPWSMFERVFGRKDPTAMSALDVIRANMPEFSVGSNPDSPTSAIGDAVARMGSQVWPSISSAAINPWGALAGMLAGAGGAPKPPAPPEAGGFISAMAPQGGPREYSSTSSTPMPGVPGLSTSQLPQYPTVEPMRGIDPAAYDKFNALRVMMPPPMAQGDKVANMIAGMASGARGAKTAGDVLLGAAGGGGAAASQAEAQNRAELMRGSEKTFDLQKLLAEMEVRKAEAAAQGGNYGVQARNLTAQGQFGVGTRQVEMDTATANKMAEMQHQLDMSKFQTGIPQYTVDKDGNTTLVHRKFNPDGTLTTEIKVDRSNDFKTLSEKVKEVETLVGKGSPIAAALGTQVWGKYGDTGLKMGALHDMVYNNQVGQVLGEDNFKKLKQEADKSIPPEERGQRTYEDTLKKVMYSLVLKQYGQGGLPDNIFLPKLQSLGSTNAQSLKMAPRPGQ